MTITLAKWSIEDYHATNLVNQPNSRVSSPALMTAKPQISNQLRRTVTERAKGCCEYCQSQEMFSTQIFSIEHILPKNWV
jgi:hypothetical protein